MSVLTARVKVKKKNKPRSNTFWDGSHPIFEVHAETTAV